MSNRSRIIVAVCIVAGVLGLILLDLTLSSGSARPSRTEAKEDRNPPPPDSFEQILNESLGSAPLENSGNEAPPREEAMASEPERPFPPGDPPPVKNVEHRNPPPRNGQALTHTVANGENLWTIAKKYYGKGAEWKRIAEANPGISGRYLKVGEKIVIPPAQKIEKGPRDIPGTEGAEIYSVRKGDTFESISKKKWGTPRWGIALFKYNQRHGIIRSPEKLQVGQQILIPPDPGAMAGRTVSGKEPVTAGASGRIHTVARGESLWKIAIRYAPDPSRVTDMIRKIVEANPDKLRSANDLVRAGWKLVIPE